MKKFNFDKIKSFLKRKDKLKSFINGVKKYISTNVLFCSYILITLLMATVLRGLTIGNIFEFRPFLMDIVCIVLFGSFGYFIKPKKQYIYFMTLTIIDSILCIINSIYYKFYLSFVSVSLIPALKQLNGVESAILTRIGIINIIYIIGPIIYLIILRRLKKGNYFDYVSKHEKSRLLFRNTFIFGIVFVICMLFTMSALEWSRVAKQWNREYIVERLGIYSYTVNDVIQGIQPKISSLFNQDEAIRQFREFYENKEVQTKNKYTGLFEGKNVLFVHMESVQSFLYGLKINGVEVTPFMNKLIKKSKYYSNFYPQISIGTSSDTEFTLLTSLMPANNGTAFVSYADRTYVSILDLFKEKGYYTFSTHGNKADYWNRRVMHRTLGYDDFFAKDTYEITEESHMGLSDKAFFTQLVEKIKVIDSEHKKYFGTIITLTNHTPWADEEFFEHFKLTQSYTEVDSKGNKVTKEAQWLDGTEFGRYLTAVHYADEALGEFISTLEKEGLLDNTVMILYGDHTAKLQISEYNLLYNYDPKTNSVKSEDDPTYIKYDKYDNFLNNKTPLIIYSGKTGISFKGEEKSVMGMYDVLPTVTNLFKTNYSKYALGHDYYSNQEHVVIFPNGSFITDLVFYNSTEDKFITLKDTAIDSEYIERLKKYTDERLSISNGILVHNLIKKDLEAIEKSKQEKENING